MTSLKRDNSGVPVVAGVLNTDGATPTAIYANASSHSVKIEDSTSGTVTTKTLIPRDENSVTVFAAIANDGSGAIINLAVNSSGQLLVQST